MAAAVLLGVVFAGTVAASASAQQPGQSAPQPLSPLVAAPLPEVSTGGIIAAGQVPFDPAKMASAGGLEAARGGGARLDTFLSSMLSEVLLPSISLADAMVAGVGGDELAAAYEDEFSGEGGVFESADEDPGVEFVSRGPEANEDEPLRSSDDPGDFRSPSLGGEHDTPEEIARSLPDDYGGEPPAADEDSFEGDPSEDLAGMGIPGRSPEPGYPAAEPEPDYELASYPLDGGSEDEDSPETQSGGEQGGDGYASAEPPEIGGDPAIRDAEEDFYIVPTDGEMLMVEDSHDEGGFGVAPETAPEAEPEAVPEIATPEIAPPGSFPGEHHADDAAGNDYPDRGHFEDGPGAGEEVEQAVENYLKGGDGETVIQHISQETTRETGKPPEDVVERDAPPARETPVEEGDPPAGEPSPAGQPYQGAPPAEEPPVGESPHDGSPADAPPREEAAPRDEVPSEDTPLEDTPSENIGSPGSGSPPERRDPPRHTDPGLRDSREPGVRPARPDADESEAPRTVPDPGAERQRGVRSDGSPDIQEDSPDHRGAGRRIPTTDDATGEADETSSQDVRRVERRSVSQENTMIRVVSDGRRSTIERVPPIGETRRLHQAEMSFAEAVRLARDRYGGRPEGEFARLADDVSHERAQSLAATAPAAPTQPREVPTRSGNPVPASSAQTSQEPPQPGVAETDSDPGLSESVGTSPAWQVRRTVVEQAAHQQTAEQAAAEQAADAELQAELAVQQQAAERAAAERAVEQARVVAERQAQQHAAYDEAQAIASNQAEARQVAARQAAYEQQLVAQQAEPASAEPAPVQQDIQEQTAHQQRLAAQQASAEQAELGAAYEHQVAAHRPAVYSQPSWQTSTVPQSISQTSPQATPQPVTQPQVETQPQPLAAPQPQPIPQPEPLVESAPAPQPAPAQPVAGQATPQPSAVEPITSQAAAQPATQTIQSGGQPVATGGTSVSQTVTSSAEGGW